MSEDMNFPDARGLGKPTTRYAVVPCPRCSGKTHCPTCKDVRFVRIDRELCPVFDLAAPRFS